MKYQPEKEALSPLMEALEEKRQGYLNLKRASKNLYLLPLGLFIFCVLISSLHDISLFLSFMFCFGLGLFIKLKKVDSYTEEYNETYKETLIKSFVPIFHPQVVYLPGKFTTSNNIQASFLYDSLGFEEQFSCQDGFRGKTTQGLDFTLIQVRYQVDEHGQIEIKRELFVSIELPNKGYRSLVVAPGSIMKHTLERYNEKEISEEPILKQVEFEDYFKPNYTVYSQKAEDAAVLLTTPFLALIQKLEKEWKGNLRFSFVQDTLHIALPSQQHFFEADLEEAVLADTVGSKLFSELSTCLSVVEELSASLNRIKLPSPERIPLPKDLDMPQDNWDDSAYDHFIGGEI